MYLTETIAALATAAASAGIGVIRISGEASFDLIDKIFQTPKGLPMKDMKSHTIHYGYIYDEGEPIDEVLVLLFRGPRSYTGEDTVEIDCHGGPFVLNRVLETVLKAGARAAEPGEFSKRAFLNGRMDLSQAEAVMDVIDAKNRYALKSSMSQLRGSIEKTVRSMRQDLLHHMAYIESALDDPEHYSLDGYGEKLLETLHEEQNDIGRLLSASDDGRLLTEGIRTVILGKPNAGKSSLLNVLVGEDRAIVTDIEGTTRDLLEEQITIGGISLNVIDTAGIRETGDRVEQIGVDRAKNIAQEADLVIYVVDMSRPMDQNDRDIIEMIKDKKAIVLLNKSDLKQALTRADLTACLDKPMIEISAKEETGIQAFLDTLKDMFFKGKIDFNSEVYITNARQKNALMEADRALKRVENSILGGMPEDFYSIDLMDAYEALGNLTGETVGEDLVNEIFSKFCMGK